MPSISAGTKAKLITEYVAWATTTPAERKRMGLAETKAAWSRAHGITDRTLRNWAAEPHVVAAIETANAARAAAAPPPSDPLADIDPAELAEMTLLERDYTEARGILMEKVREGTDARWFQLWWNTYGKRLADAEAAATDSDFSDMSDEDLTSHVTTLLSPEAMAASLTARGYIVIEPVVGVDEPADPATETAEASE